MKINLIQVPYRLSQAYVGVGNGPARLLQAGLEQTLAERGHEVKTEIVQLAAPAATEWGTIAQLNAELGRQVRATVAEGFFPLVVSGLCNAALGTIAGLDTTDIGIIWFDAHGDFNTPETSPSGFFDGMVLAMITGLCCPDVRLEAGIPMPIPDANVVLAAVRDLDAGEQALLDQSHVQVVPASIMRGPDLALNLPPILDALRTRVHDVYVHLDIDALDPQDAPGVDYPTPAGISLEDTVAAIHRIGQRFHIRAAVLDDYNPDRDEGQRTVQTGVRLLTAIAESVKQPND